MIAERLYENFQHASISTQVKYRTSTKLMYGFQQKLTVEQSVKIRAKRLFTVAKMISVDASPIGQVKDLEIKQFDMSKRITVRV